MTDSHLLLQLAAALAVGLIVGAERGWAQRRGREGSRAAGVRTFGVAALAGGLTALLGTRLPLLAPAAFIGLSLLAAAGYLAGTRSLADYGMTTELALLVAFLLGGLATAYPREAVAVAALLALLLGTKQEMHRGLAALDRTEFIASLQLLIVAAVLLPLLPDRLMGPWEAINPRAVGWLVLLVLGLSYVGYFAVRLAGHQRGLLLTAFLGGLTSSTVVTLTYARMARAGTAPPRLLAAGIALACATMAPRIALQIFAVQPALLPYVILPLGALGLLPLAFAGVAARGSTSLAMPEPLAVRNPLAIGPALGLALALTALAVAVRGAATVLGETGVFVVSALSGVADVDAVTVSVARHAGSAFTLASAGGAIVLAAVVNTWVKAAMAAFVGGRVLARSAGLALVAAGATAALLSLAS